MPLRFLYSRPASRRPRADTGTVRVSSNYESTQVPPHLRPGRRFAPAPRLGPARLAPSAKPLPSPPPTRKKLADAALNAATKNGATYADVRIGRYLNQFIITREDKVENIVNTESYGAGVRVIADGAWGFCATDQLTPESIARAAEEAVAIAKANAKLQESPVELAPQKGVGEVSWKTPIERTPSRCPSPTRSTCCMAANAAATKAGANFVNSNLFLVNEQKYFASTDGSYIDQDVHRIWPTFGVTAIDPKTGKFATRRRSAPRADAATNTSTPSPRASSRPRHALHDELRHDRGRHRRRQAGARKARRQVASRPGSTTSCSTRATCG